MCCFSKTVSGLGMVLTAMLGPATFTATADPSTSSSPTETPSESPAPSPAPSSSEAPPEDTRATSLADLTVTAEFDKTSYATGEAMDITVTVKNNATDPIFADVFIGSEPDAISVTSDNTLRTVSLEGGESTSRKLAGVMSSATFTTAKLYLRFIADSGETELTFPIAITPRVGHVTGSVFRDANGNGRFDGGEGLGGATLNWSSKLGNTGLAVTTDASGAYALDVPVGPFSVLVEATGVDIESRSVTVTESGVDGLLFRATVPLWNLAVAMRFTKDTYKPDETPTVRVSLTNNNELPMAGIVAHCYGDGPPNLMGTGPGWAGLAGDGVAIAPHSTTSVDVSEPMPAGVADYGYVAADCYFNYSEASSSPGPRATAYASVPGKFGDVTGQVASYVEADLTGFRVVLAAPDGGCPITEATTDADGKFSFRHLPVGRYDFYLVPPTPHWGARMMISSGTMRVVAGRENSLSFLVYPTQSDINLTKPPDCGGTRGDTPGPQGTVLPGLAHTGASLAIPVGAGLLALLAGAVVVVLARRREAG
jgi:hypothetical protein